MRGWGVSSMRLSYARVYAARLPGLYDEDGWKMVPKWPPMRNHLQGDWPEGWSLCWEDPQWDEEPATKLVIETASRHRVLLKTSGLENRADVTPLASIPHAFRLPLGVVHHAFDSNAPPFECVVGIEGETTGTTGQPIAIRAILYRFVPSPPTFSIGKLEPITEFSGALAPRMLSTHEFEDSGLGLQDTDPYGRMTLVAIAK